MRDQKNRTLTAAERKELDARMRKQQRNGNENKQNTALADLLRFVSGQDHQPDAPLQLEALVQNINLLMDDELIAALEQMEEVYVYGNGQLEVDQEYLNAAWPVRELLKKLRDLQKVRLRDAIQRFTNSGVN